MHGARLALFIALFTPCSSVGAGQSDDPVTLLIAFDSRTGQTESLSEAIEEGARDLDGIRTVRRSLERVTVEEILSADGILVGTPVHWAGLSAATKSFLERIGSVLTENRELGPSSRPKVRTAGAFVTAGAVASGKELARLDVIAAFLNMRFVVIGGEEADGFGNLGAQATTGESDPGLSEEELLEAKRFGVRFATLTRTVTR